MHFERLHTRLDGPLYLQPRVFGDERGFFVETFRASTLAELGVTDAFVQDNHSRSAYGVVRGMHFQLDPPAGKLVRCGRGRILDVLVDVRPGSPTFGEWEGFELSDVNARILWAPPGFAHGFCVLSELADVLYKQTAYWSPESDRAIALDDPAIGIDWPLREEERVVSDRDRHAPCLADVEPELGAA
ncbi:MAG TPA: dTDP-4-dehydrorhamnose 3,5-epimerase [Solirubrobacteraceae bacterium]|nr:dTDP-4-dehydrorhamnose 3,5-epimerase [Solirubrobacteraceae bacterium]